MLRHRVPISLAAMAVAGLFLTQAVAAAEEGRSAAPAEATTDRSDSNGPDEGTMSKRCEAMMKDMAGMREAMNGMQMQMEDMAAMHEVAKTRMQEMHQQMMAGMEQMRDDMARMHPTS